MARFELAQSTPQTNMLTINITATDCFTLTQKTPNPIKTNTNKKMFNESKKLAAQITNLSTN